MLYGAVTNDLDLDMSTYFVMGAGFGTQFDAGIFASSSFEQVVFHAACGRLSFIAGPKATDSSSISVIQST